MKKVTIIYNLPNNWEEEFIFRDDCFPMAKHFADVWAKHNNFKLVKSPKKIAELFPGCHRVACNQDEVVFYAVKQPNKRSVS